MRKKNSLLRWTDGVSRQPPFGMLLVSLFMLYAGTALLGLTFDAVGGFASLVWPPAGIALAALLIFGSRLWPAVALAAFVINLLAGAPFLSACGMALGNTLEALAGAYLLKRNGFQPSLSRLRDATNLITLAALLSTTISATVGVASLWLGGVVSSAALRPTWQAWWVGDVFGVLIVAPLLLVLWSTGKRRLSASGPRAAEKAALVASILLIAAAFLTGGSHSALSTVELPYLVFPVAIWAALRFDARVSVVVTFILSAIAIAATAEGLGPFARESLREGLALLHLFMGAVAVTSLSIACSVAEHVHSDELSKEAEGRETAEKQIRSIIETANDAFIAMDSSGRITDWNPRAEAIFGWTRSEALGRSLGALVVPPSFREAHSQGLQRFLATGEGTMLGRRIETVALHKSGREVPVELTVSATKRGELYIFNAFLHDISDRRRAGRIQEGRLAVTRVLAEATTLTEAFEGALAIVCKALNWGFGAVWVIDPAADKQLACVSVWHEDEAGLAEFAKASRGMRLAYDQGLPGLVWRKGAPEWIGDVQLDESFPRADAAVRAGLRGGAAFPIMAGAEFVGVAEFFSRSLADADAKLLETMADITGRLGVFVQRRRAEETSRRSDERYRQLVETVREQSIIEHRRTEEALRALNEELERRVEERTREAQRQQLQLRMIADALPILVAEVDAGEHLRFLNKACRRWFNPIGDIIGKTSRDVTNEATYKLLEPHIKRVLAGEEVWFEHSALGTEKRVDFSINFIPEFDEHGQVTGYISVCTDITKHKEATEAAEAANAAKSAFLANMSHEIRTPLGAILGFSELIADPNLTTAERTHFVGVVKRNGELLSSIINDILDLSKVEAGRLEIDAQDIALSEVLTDTTSLLNLQAAEKGIKLIVTAEGPVPGVISTDPLRLRQILLNIIGNAIKFTNKGFVEVKLQLLRQGDRKSMLEFIVEDTGTGISEEQRARLFEPFSQADASTTRRFGGTGLGLTLSRRLARLLGGDVVLTRSELGKGSTFTITVDPGEAKRVLFEAGHGEGAGAPVPQMKPSEVKLDGLQILLVEDAPDNRLLVGRFLKLAGATVDTAANGKDALQKVAEKDYDVLLMDLQMPVMDGFEATAALRTRGFEKPIIALTAHAFKEERKRCLESGFDDHLSKPINRSLLLERLASFAPGGELPH